MSKKMTTSVNHQFNLRCAFTAWVVGWAINVFLPSAVFAFLGLSKSASAIGQGFDYLLATTWQVADDVSPMAKLMIGILFALFNGAIFLAIPRNFLTQVFAFSASGTFSVILTLLLIPVEYSRGFGIGLTGARLDLQTLPVYFIGGLISGLIFYATHYRCYKKRVVMRPN